MEAAQVSTSERASLVPRLLHLATRLGVVVLSREFAHTLELSISGE